MAKQGVSETSQCGMASLGDAVVDKGSHQCWSIYSADPPLTVHVTLAALVTRLRLNQ